MSRIAGYLIFISLIITLYSYFQNSSIFLYSGITAWLSLFLLYFSIKKKFLLNTLFILSCILFLFSFNKGFVIDFVKVFTVNQYLLALLIAVGFLRLIATPKAGKVKALPSGKNSFLKTYLGIHLFGSVINLSSLILVADKMYKYGKLTKTQVVLLGRAFSSDAYWSPFFVAFAAASTYSPNLKTSTILFVGLFLALCSFIFTYKEITSNKEFDLENFKGYPIHFETLYVPVILALLVLITKHYNENIKVIILISLYSVLLTMFVLLLKKGVSKFLKKISSHISEELPLMKMELSLFLIAGMFGVAISSILIGYEIAFPFKNFDGISASILLLVFILLSFVGIHPIISIAIVGNWVDDFNHTLLAMTFLMSWATAVSTSPFSGLNLTMQARYELKAMDIFKLNISYAIKMYLLGVIVLNVVSFMLGI